MSNDKPIVNIDLGELSKPATVLIEKISDAIGGYYRPRQIERVAQAEARADIIRAEAQIEITETQRRGLQRLAYEEGRRQENIESITAKAAGQIGDNAQPDDLDNDWITDFFDKCRNVSDEEMQALWARILADEATNPGKFSKRTIALTSTLDKADANLFTKLMTFSWSIGGLVPLVFNSKENIYNKHGINFESLMHLSEAGLITFNDVAGYQRMGYSKEIALYYYGKYIGLILPKDKDNVIDTGKVLLTSTGIELASICNSKPDDEFLEYVVGRWHSANYSPYCAIIKPT